MSGKSPFYPFSTLQTNSLKYNHQANPCEENIYQGTNSSFTIMENIFLVLLVNRGKFSPRRHIFVAICNIFTRYNIGSLFQLVKAGKNASNLVKFSGQLYKVYQISRNKSMGIDQALLQSFETLNLIMLLIFTFLQLSQSILTSFSNYHIPTPT